MNENRWIVVSADTSLRCKVHVSKEIETLKNNPKAYRIIKLRAVNIYRYFKQHVNPDGEDFTSLYETGDITGSNGIEILYYRVVRAEDFVVEVADYQFASLIEYINCPCEETYDEKATSLQSSEHLNRIVQYVVGYLQIPGNCSYLQKTIALHYSIYTKRLFDSIYKGPGRSWIPVMTEAEYIRLLDMFFDFFVKYQKIDGMNDALVREIEKAVLKSDGDITEYSSGYVETVALKYRQEINRNRSKFDNYIDCSQFLLKLLVYRLPKVTHDRMYPKMVTMSKGGELGITSDKPKESALPERWKYIFQFSKTPYGSILCDENFIAHYAYCSYN